MPLTSTNKSLAAWFVWLPMEQPRHVIVALAVDVLLGGGLLDVLPIIVQQHG